jgi:hypothetical protein
VTRIRIYFDEDSMSHVLVKTLRAKGEDVRTAFEEGMTWRPDDEQLDYAVQLGRCIYSCNMSDFCRLHTEYMAQGRSHFGIVVCPQQDMPPSEQARRLKKLLDSRTADEMRDMLEYLSSWS